MSSIREQIDTSLNQLRNLIWEAVRSEQRTDQLTKLPNDAALTELLQNTVDNGSSFWIAFVEIDYFKRINDKWGYENADLLLDKVAKRLSYCSDLFEEKVTAFRAHGDEFYLVGLLPTQRDHIEDRLNHLREDISKIRVPVVEAESMKCTVSIGWIASEDARTDEHDLSPRSVKLLLEHSIAYAKTTGRDVVVKYQPEMKKSALDERRDNCASCKTSFTAAIPKQSSKNSALHCPNCGVLCASNADVFLAKNTASSSPGAATHA
ncbi:MAG TPA: diguanylate cyclase [Polyangium sp.]|nr:diguanylate cyclase [Polyangium sp.]